MPGAPVDYCFSARARDRAGSLGAWSAERCATTPTDDRELYGRGWARSGDRSAFRRTLTRTRQRGRRLRMENVRVGSLSLLARTCPACSAGRVSHGGRDLGGFKLSSKRRHNRVAIAVIDYTASRRGLLGRV